MKQNYEKQINELKEIMAKKEDIKYFAKRRELDYIKENLEALSDKYNNFERVTESKIGFIESNMSTVLEKGEVWTSISLASIGLGKYSFIFLMIPFNSFPFDIIGPITFGNFIIGSAP